MPAELKFVKGKGGAWYPADMFTLGWSEKQEIGTVTTGKFTRNRNIKRHRKFFALLKVGIQYWNPQPILDGKTGEWFTPEADPETFREWITIKCGHFEERYYPDGSVELRAKSIAFEEMEEEAFRRLLNTAVEVIMDMPSALEMSIDEFRQRVYEILQFGEIGI